MTSQEKLEAFAPYLPYNVHYITNVGDNFELKNIDVYVEGVNLRRNGQFYIDDIKLILRPLSDLTKPCLEGGKVPIVELAKIVRPNENWFLDKIMASNGWMYLIYNEYSFSLGDGSCGDGLCINQLQLFQQLYKWHFWLGDQSEFGKSIIDINTLN